MSSPVDIPQKKDNLSSSYKSQIPGWTSQDNDQRRERIRSNSIEKINTKTNTGVANSGKKSGGNATHKKLKEPKEPKEVSLNNSASASATGINATTATTTTTSASNAIHVLLKEYRLKGVMFHPEVIRMAHLLKSAGDNDSVIMLFYAIIKTIECDGDIKQTLNFLIQSLSLLTLPLGNTVRYFKSIHTRDSQLAIPQLQDFIREKIVYSSVVISSHLEKKITPGNVVLVNEYTPFVERLKGIEIVYVSTGEKNRMPSFHPDTKVTIIPINSLNYVLSSKKIDKALIYAHAVLVNGNVVAKSGSALVAMECSIRNVPLVVLCESYKFSEKVHLDSFVYNESIEGDSKASIEEEDEMYFTTIEKKAKAATYPPYSKIKYDLTPSELVSVVVTEVGLIPSTSVPVVIREGFKIKK